MRQDAELKALQERAAELVLSASSQTDDLTDDEARPLIAWAVAQAEEVAREVAAGGARGTAEELADRDAAALLADRLTPVRKIMRTVSSLAVDRHRLDAQEVADEIDHVADLAEQLPGRAMRPRMVAGSGARPASDLAERQAEMDNQAFVMALLGLFPGTGTEAARVEYPGARRPRANRGKTSG